MNKIRNSYIFDSIILVDLFLALLAFYGVNAIKANSANSPLYIRGFMSWQTSCLTHEIKKRNNVTCGGMSILLIRN